MLFSNKSLKEYINLHKEELVDIIRMYLGIVLIIKGIQFFTNIDYLNSLIETTGINMGIYSVLGLAHIIIFIHIIGGFFLALGLLTKFSSTLQIPVVLSAILFVHSNEGIMSNNIHFATFILLLTIVFALHGSGKLSIDYYLENYKEHDIKFLHKWDKN